MPRQSRAKVWIPVFAFETDQGEIAYEVPELRKPWNSAELRRAAEQDLWKTFYFSVGAESPAKLTWVQVVVDLP